MTTAEELAMARDYAEYCKQRVEWARAEHRAWRDAFSRQQIKIAGLVRRLNLERADA